MTRDELEKEATEFEENYTVYEVSKRKNGTDYTKKVCDVTVQEAYVASAEPREKRITELEQKLEQTEKDLADYQFNYPTIKELENEKCELLGIIQDKDKVIADLRDNYENFKAVAEPEIKSLKQNLEDTEIINKTLEKRYKSRCDKFKELDELYEKLILENKLLGERCNQLLADKGKLTDENAELKDDNKIMADNYSKMEQKFYIQLSKAKKLIKGLLDIPDLIEDRTSEHTELIGQAEQFLKECE